MAAVPPATPRCSTSTIPDGACTSTSHAGTASDPLCNLPATIATASDLSSKLYVHYAGSTVVYAPISVVPTVANTANGFVLSIVGPGRSTAKLASVSGNTTTGTNAILVNEAAGITVGVTVDGVDLVGAVRNSISVSGGTVGNDASAANCAASNGTVSVTLKRSNLRVSGQFGFKANSCAVVLDGNVINANKLGGLSIDGSIGPSSGVYTIVNNMIVDNGNTAGVTPAITMSNTTSGLIWFNTVANNKSNVANGVGGIDCSGNGADIWMSIFWGNAKHLNSQFTGNCRTFCSLAIMLLPDSVIVPPELETFEIFALKQTRAIASPIYILRYRQARHPLRT